MGDPASDYANLPAPYNKSDYLYQYLDKYVQWNKYLEEDVFAQKNAGALFNSGKAAASEWNIRAMADVKKTIQQAIPGADIEYFVYNTKVANLQPQALGTNYIPYNHAVVTVTAKNVDRTMKVLDRISAAGKTTICSPGESKASTGARSELMAIRVRMIKLKNTASRGMNCR